MALDFDYTYDPGNTQIFNFYFGSVGVLYFGIQVIDFNGDGVVGSQLLGAFATDLTGTNIGSILIGLTNSFRITLIFNGSTILVDVDGITWGAFYPGDLTVPVTPDLTFGSFSTGPTKGFMLRQIAFAGFI